MSSTAEGQTSTETGETQGPPGGAEGTGGGLNPLVVVGVAFVLGFLLAKLLDRGSRGAARG